MNEKGGRWGEGRGGGGGEAGRTMKSPHEIIFFKKK